jgi:kynureninase
LSADRTHAAALDAADPLGSFRSEFVVDDQGPIYLDGNSLGPLPRRVASLLERVVRDEWGSGLVESWEHWIELPARVGALVSGLIGADPSAVTVSDSTSVNLYKLAAAALGARPGRSTIVMLDGEFPTDRYLMDALAARTGGAVRTVATSPASAPDPGILADALGDDTALVVLSAVSYRSAAIADMAGISEAAHAAGAMVLWDLSHAVGSIPIDLDATGADLAVGCTYKYLSGGPGAPAFLYVRPDLNDELDQPIQGWFGHARQFGFEERYEPAAGVTRFLAGTPPILSVAAAEPGVALVAEAGIEAIRAKSITATSLLVALWQERLRPLGFHLASPIDAERRGSHVALTHRDALAISRTLREERSVITDFRAPAAIRLGVSPLVTRHTDVWDAVEAIRQVTAGGRYGSIGEPRVT